MALPTKKYWDSFYKFKKFSVQIQLMSNLKNLFWDILSQEELFQVMVTLFWDTLTQDMFIKRNSLRDIQNLEKTH